MKKCLICLVKRVSPISGHWNENGKRGEPTHAVCGACRRSICLNCMSKNTYHCGWYHEECIPFELSLRPFEKIRLDKDSYLEA